MGYIDIENMKCSHPKVKEFYVSGGMTNMDKTSLIQQCITIKFENGRYDFSYSGDPKEIEKVEEFLKTL